MGRPDHGTTFDRGVHIDAATDSVVNAAPKVTLAGPLAPYLDTAVIEILQLPGHSFLRLVRFLLQLHHRANLSARSDKSAAQIASRGPPLVQRRALIGKNQLRAVDTTLSTLIMEVIADDAIFQLAVEYGVITPLQIRDMNALYSNAIRRGKAVSSRPRENRGGVSMTRPLVI